MGRWKDHVFDHFEQMAREPELEGLDDDELWALAEERAQDRISAQADYLRDLTKEGRS